MAQSVLSLPTLSPAKVVQDPSWVKSGSGGKVELLVKMQLPMNLPLLENKIAPPQRTNVNYD